MTSEQRYPKRLIEVDLPIKRISAHARREKNIHHGHISTLHLWWARRPLGVCRAVACASLWPDPADPICPTAFAEAARKAMLHWSQQNLGLCSDEDYRRFLNISKKPALLGDPVELRRALLDFIADYAKWENSTRPEFNSTSRALTAAAHATQTDLTDSLPLLIDPFAGGGAIPLEASRIGAEAFASDINPVAVVINRLLIQQLPQRAGNILAEFRQEARKVSTSVHRALADVYPTGGDQPIAYIWARTIRCEGPGCGVELPLMTAPWFARRSGRHVWISFRSSPNTAGLDYDIRSAPAAPQPILRGTAKLGSATCPVCGYTTPKQAVYAQLKRKRGGAWDAQLLAVVRSSTTARRAYSKPSTADYKQVVNAKEAAARLPIDALAERINPISPGKFGSGVASPTRIGCEVFRDLFTPRQQVVLLRFSDEISRVSDSVIRTLLACALDRLADYNSAHCRWNINTECVGDTFGRQAISISWCFGEVNPFADAAGSWKNSVAWVERVVEHINDSQLAPGHSEMASATQMSLPDDAADVLFTDPPYYGAVMYGDLSDFFYVFLKRSLATANPDLFATILVEKSEEIVATPTSRGPLGEMKDAAFYEEQMTLALAEARRVVRPGGIGIIVFAHKSTKGWEAMLSAAIRAGWIVTASWPIDTERQGRTNAQGTAALSSSVHLVCRPRENADGTVRTEEVGNWREVLRELPHRIHEWMPRLASEGVVGADGIFACLGPALEVFSRYSYVEKATGERVELKEYLEHVWAAVAHEALTMIFEDADATGLEEDARLTAMWLWTLSTSANGEETELEPDGKEVEDDESPKAKPARGFSLEFDAARKIAQGLGAHLEILGNLVEIKGDQARLLPVAERTKYLFGKDARQQAPASRRGKPKQMTLFAELEVAEQEAGWGETGIPSAGETTLDRVHQAMILFAAGRAEALKRFLVEEGVGRDAKLWKLAQSLSALYPAGTDEKRWVDGVLARKKSLGFG